MDFKTARSNMVENQIRANKVTNLSVINAFKDVPREKVLKIESIMDPKDTNASDNLKVSKDDIIESVAEKILNSKEIIKVIDPKDSSEVGSINPSKVIKVLFGG